MQGVDRSNGIVPSVLMNSTFSSAHHVIDNNCDDDALGNHHPPEELDSGENVVLVGKNDVPGENHIPDEIDNVSGENDIPDENNVPSHEVRNNEIRRQHKGRAPSAPEVLEELMHPDMVSVPMTQLDTEQELIAEMKKCNQQKGSKAVLLEISGTIFYMSLMHYQGENLSVPIFNDIKLKRIEFLDFTRRSDDKLLYLWDSRQAIVLSMLNDDNVFENRLFIAMTNLYLPFGDVAGTINQEFVLLDILVRMDPYTLVDALVGVIATGEVRLWKYSKDHLRFLYCDFQFPLQKGEEYWTAKREEFYVERGLYYDPARRIPRDPDISNLNRIYSINKQYLKDYPRAYVGKGFAAKQRENFEKWRLLPGKNKTTEEENENIVSLLSRAKNAQIKKVTEADTKEAAEKVVEEQKKQASAKRAETRKINAASKAAEAAAAAAAIAKVAVVNAAKIKSAPVMKAPSSAPSKTSEDEDTVENAKSSAGGNKRSKSKSSTAESGEHITVVPSGPSLAASTQVLTIVIDTTSSTSSSSSANSKTVQVSAAADKHANDLVDAFKIEQTKRVIEREKDIEELRQREHAFTMQQERDNLALKAQRHATQNAISQQKIDIENRRSQLSHDQERRFYQQLQQQADKNSHSTAMSRESASAAIDIQRDKFNLQKEMEEWQDDRSAKQAREFRHNVQQDSRIAWQREDALRRLSAQGSWYSAELANSSHHHRQQQEAIQGGGQKKNLHQGHGDEGKKRKRGEDDGDGGGAGDEAGSDEEEEEEDFQYISKPFKPKTLKSSQL